MGQEGGVLRGAGCLARVGVIVGRLWDCTAPLQAAAVLATDLCFCRPVCSLSEVLNPCMESAWGQLPLAPGVGAAAHPERGGSAPRAVGPACLPQAGSRARGPQRGCGPLGGGGWWDGLVRVGSGKGLPLGAPRRAVCVSVWMAATLWARLGPRPPVCCREAVATGSFHVVCACACGLTFLAGT